MTQLIEVFLFIIALGVALPVIFWSLVAFGYPSIVAEEVRESNRLFLQVEQTLKDNERLREKLREMGVYDE